MKVTIDIYKVEAKSQVVLEAEEVEEAKEKALTMAGAHGMTFSSPEKEFVTVIVKAVS